MIKLINYYIIYYIYLFIKISFELKIIDIIFIIFISGNKDIGDILKYKRI